VLVVVGPQQIAQVRGDWFHKALYAYIYIAGIIAVWTHYSTANAASACCISEFDLAVEELVVNAPLIWARASRACPRIANGSRSIINAQMENPMRHGKTSKGKGRGFKSWGQPRSFVAARPDATFRLLWTLSIKSRLAAAHRSGDPTRTQLKTVYHLRIDDFLLVEKVILQDPNLTLLNNGATRDKDPRNKI
jgi:hypothetical protein